MQISITSTRPTNEQIPQIEQFLGTFLPRVRKFPGVLSVYHYYRPSHGDSYTVIILESDYALKCYRESNLFTEALEFQKMLNLPGTREDYPLIVSL